MPSAVPRILVVEDDERVRMEVFDALQASGAQVELCSSLAGARRALRSEFDLLVLDLGLPDGDGLDLCRDLRASGRSLPILVLTARGEPEERVRGLEVGADDYLAKPFFSAELVARVRALLRRAGPTALYGRARLGELWADPTARAAGKGSATLDLTPKEFDLLLFLLRHPGRVWTREQLLDRVWGMGYRGGARTVDLHVTRLRKKIEEDPGDPRCLQTVWGVGYRMGEEAEEGRR